MYDYKVFLFHLLTLAGCHGMAHKDMVDPIKKDRPVNSGKERNTNPTDHTLVPPLNEDSTGRPRGNAMTTNGPDRTVRPGRRQ